VIEHGHRDA